jgi:two-component system response regulator HydG
MATILVVDDDLQNLRFVCEVVESGGHKTLAAPSGADALAHARRLCPDLVLLDLKMSSMDGIETATHLRALHPHLRIIIMTAYVDYSATVDGIRLEVFEWIQKTRLTFSGPRLLEVVAAALEGRRPGLATPDPAEPARLPVGFAGMIGDCPAMREVYQQIAGVAPLDWPVLVEGETGTGKELVARAIHAYSRRSDGPFVPVNVTTLPDTLAASQLFGHVKGAFTDARETKPGLFTAANGGIVFLDEVGSLLLPIQAMLLRVLQEREVMPLGTTERIPVDVRVIAATNRNLAAAVTKGEFREDLYYRLAGYTLSLPALRDRRGDVSLLVQYYLPKLAGELRRPTTISPAALRMLETYGWPGNVRQVEQALRTALLNARGATIEVGHLPEKMLNGREGVPLPDHKLAPGVTLPRALEEFERRCIVQALEDCEGKREAAAKRLGIDPKTLRRKLRRQAVDPDAIGP